MHRRGNKALVTPRNLGDVKPFDIIGESKVSVKLNASITMANGFGLAVKLFFKFLTFNIQQ